MCKRSLHYPTISSICGRESEQKMSKKFTTEDFRQKLNVQHRGDFEVLGDYVNGRTKILIRHKCGYEFHTRPDYISHVEYGKGCPVCSNNYNSVAKRLKQKDANLWITHPNIANLLQYPNDGYDVISGSRKLLHWVCPDCGHIQKRKVHTLLSNGFICEVCGDGFSKPEKFIRSLLIQLGVNFETQKSFEWSQNRRYDFYFDGILCEVHGLQHYEHGFQCVGARSLDDEIKNDILKQELAYHNGFTNDTYIVLDCRKSQKEWIKNSVLNSRLANIYDLSKVDWNKCEKDCLSSFAIKICKLWNDGYSSTEIKEKLNISKKSSIVSKYLNMCNDLGLCIYNPSESRKDASRHKIVCLNTNEVFNSIKEAEDIYNIKNISGCCIGQIKSAGKHPKTKESLVWRYYEDYINMSQDDIKMALDVKSKKLRKVICLNNMKVFDSLVDGAIYAGLKNASSISACFRNEQKYAGRHPDTGELLRWMPYDKYLKSTASLEVGA